MAYSSLALIKMLVRFSYIFLDSSTEIHLDCFACGLENGFRIYNTDPIRQTQRQGSKMK